MAFIMLRHVPSVPTFWRVFLLFFNHKWTPNFVKSFFCISWGYPMVFIPQLVSVVYHNNFQILKNSCLPGINPDWSWCMFLLGSVRSYFVKDFYIFIHQWYWPAMCVCVCMWCEISLVLVSGWCWNEFRSVHFSSIFWNSFRNLSANFSLNIFICKAICTLGLGRFLLLIQLH